MGFSGLFSIGLSGVAAQSASLEAISNNIANSQTVGFRRARTDFSQLIAQEQSGSINNAGTGVSANSRQLITEQGFISRTQNATDLAIAGDGFFVVSQTSDASGGDSSLLYTRAGDFRIDGDGNLINSAGYFLQGQPIGPTGAAFNGGINSLQTINLANIEGSATATTSLTLSAVFSNLGAVSPAAATYNPADPANNLTSQAIDSNLNQTYTVFDNEGNASQITLAFLRTGTNQVAIEAFDPANTDGLPIASGVIAFDNTGSVDPHNSTFPASLTLPGGTVDIDLSSLSINTGATRVVTSTSDGTPFGNVNGFEINNDGTLTATLSNGQTRDLFQIPLAVFTNPEGLNSVAATAFQFDPTAGTRTIETAGSNRAGQIEGASLETSTVDIGLEFSTLIQTQRAYSANARILSVADDLLQTLNDTAA